MWLQVSFICLPFLTLFHHSQAQDQASLSLSNDPTGRCHYTFTVESPKESSCSGGSTKPEIDGILSRITLLEALVSRLMAGGDRSAGAGGRGDGEENLLEAHSQVTREKNQLQQDKERLSRQVHELQSTLAELSQEVESLRQRPCQQNHTSGGPQQENGPASGTYISEQGRDTQTETL